MGDTVTVACKLPHGLQLRLYETRKVFEPILGGGSREVKMAFQVGDTHVLNGWSHPQNAAPKCTISVGYALTQNIPKEFWDEWLKQNSKTAFVANGLIFAANTRDAIDSESKNNEKIRCGLERLDPTKPPRGIKRSDLMPSDNAAA